MTSTETTNWEAATDAVNQAQSILVVSHVFPDGDAIGSLLGLVNALQHLGKAVDHAIDGGIPEPFTFLPGAESVRGELKTGSWDLMISLDASDEERTGIVGEYGRQNSKTVINLDHHTTNTFFGDIYLVDPNAVAATEIVYRWLQWMKISITVDVAVPLLTGLVTDTVGFRTSNVTADTLMIAQGLMQAGASLAEITERALDIRSFSLLNLWKEALQSLALTEHGIIVVEITRDDFARTGVSSESDVGLAGFLIRVKEAKISAVFRETDDGNVTLSFRSKPGFDVSRVAFTLGGGGHRQASGATIPGPLKAAKDRVLPLLVEAAQNGKLVVV